MHAFTRLAAAAAFVALGPIAPAFAHAHLKTSFPAADSVQTTPPTEIDITFTEDVNIKFTGATLTGADNKAVTLGDGMLMGGNAMFMAPITGTLAPGKYTVDWHALSTDGHKTNGSFSFTVQ
ncbi:MAG TPA: copper homeostasis periplasmic binding protein CopC [Bauldia sp.]|nr:copper homeostasis periplasmic binding protein CopC [Bauldia sp.]